MDTNPLTNLEKTIREHWAEHRPQMVANLQAAGTLDKAVETAVTLTEEAVFALTSKGTPLLAAWEAVREEWAILPSETDMPNLGEQVQTLIDEE